MDARTQLDAERKRIEAELLTLEQEWLRAVSEDGDVFGLRLDLDQNQDRALRIASLLSSLGLVNAELAAIRHGDENGLRS